MSTLFQGWTKFWTPVNYPPVQGQKRGQIKQFLEQGRQRRLLIWESVMAVATIAYIATAFFSDAKGVDIPDLLLWGFPILFMAEFAVRFANAPDRKEYVSQHWIDAVTAIPLIGYFRAIRLLRLVRLLGMMRLIATVGSRQKERTSFRFLVPLLFVVWVGSACALWLVENPDNHDMRTFSDALSMAFGAATSFGYARVKPITADGQLIAGLLIFVGLGLVTFASSQLTSKLLGTPDVDHRLSRVEDRLSAIEKSLDELKAMQNTEARRSPENQNPS
jgi:hypothetical protein